MIKKLILLLITGVLFAGCGTTKFKVYKSLEATQTAVVAAMETFRSLDEAGEIDDQERAEVRSKYERYQQLFSNAVVAAEFDYKSRTPYELANQVSSLILLIDTL